MNFKESNFYVNTDKMKWENQSYPRRASIDGFGFGGINYHITLEEFNSNTIIKDDIYEILQSASYEKFTSEVIVIGGNDINELLNNLKAIEKIILFVKSEEFSLFCYNCNLEFTNYKYKCAFVGKDPYDFKSKLISTVKSFTHDINISKIFNPVDGIFFNKNMHITNDQIGFVFPGQGSQYFGMGSELFNTFPQAHQIIKEADDIFRNNYNESLADLMFTKQYYNDDLVIEKEKKINSTEYTQPAVTSINLMYLKMLEILGIAPMISCGHSLGEYSALFAAGYLSFNDVMTLTSIRGREQSLISEDSDPGGMASISKDHIFVSEHLKNIKGYVGFPYFSTI